MQSEDHVRLGHMLDYAREALTFAAGKSRSDLDSDLMPALAVTRAIEIIGEAATHISQDYRDQHSDIPWKQIVGMRNRLVHAYTDVDTDVLWHTITEDLPPLIEPLEKILGSH